MSAEAFAVVVFFGTSVLAVVAWVPIYRVAIKRGFRSGLGEGTAHATVEFVRRLRRAGLSNEEAASLLLPCTDPSCAGCTKERLEKEAN